MSPAPRTAAILAAITFAVFSPTLSSEFVYDARLQILTDPFPHDPRNWPVVLSFAVLGMDVLDFNRPVHLASIMLDAALWGRSSFGFHLTSILLHCGNVVLLWLLLREVLARGPRVGDATAAPGVWFTAADVAPLAGAAFFAVHPVVVEAVCEPTFREDLLVGGFMLGALVLASRWGGNEGRASGDRSAAWWRAGACAVCCLLACGSKESGMVAPLVLAASWWLFHRAGDARWWATALAGGTMLSAAFIAARFLLEPTESAIFEHKPEYIDGSPTAALLVEPRILALYAQLVVCPVNLCADYGGASIRHLPLWLSLIVDGAIVGTLAWAGWRDRRIAFGAALLILPLLPVSNLVPIYRPAADRYLYVPLAGVAVFVACLVEAGWSRLSRHQRPILLVGCMVVLVSLTTACIARQRVWSNQLELWQNTFARNRGSYSAANGLATAYREDQRFVEAERLARYALVLSGSARGDTWVTLALALDGQGRTADALVALETALEKDPRLGDPQGRVAALAMDLPEADALGKLLARRPASPQGTSPAEP